MQLDGHRAFLAELAEASARVIKPLFGDRSLEVETKADDSPVTAADRGAEQVLRELIRRRHPDHG
ncbi:MAG: histidinol-phosphatase, partial [Opitutaceae bacterium]